MKLFHPSVEGAQHGAKGLGGFVKFAKEAGAAGCQPTNFMLEDGKGGFRTATEIKQMFADAGLMLDGISAHCPFWAHTTAWTGSKTIRPFIPADMANSSLEVIENWAEDYIMRLLFLCSELGVKVVPMFWGVAFGWEVATGYPWGFWKGADYDLIAEGCERFVEKTQRIRDLACNESIVLAHEIHPGTAAVCAHDFLKLVEICDGDNTLAVNADPSHCWEGENWQARYNGSVCSLGLAGRIYGCHMKNHHIWPGEQLRCMVPEWQYRPMQFTALDHGDIDLVRYTELMMIAGCPARYCKLMGTKTAPLVVEAEGAFENLDAISARGIQWVRDNCCFDVAAGSFEDGMGAEKA